MRGGSGVSGPALADPTTRWTDLGKRVASAVILAPLALTCLWVGGTPFQILIVLAAGGVAVEWVWLCGQRVSRVSGGIVVVGVLAASVCATQGYALAGLGAVGGVAVLVFGLAVSGSGTVESPPPLEGGGWGEGAVPETLQPPSQSPTNPTPQPPPTTGGGENQRQSPLWLPLGLPYVGLCAIALIWLRADPAAGRANLLFLLLLVWASDIGAYLAGRLLGGPRLAPSISPGKTWSGAAGGLVAAVAAGLACAFVVQPPDSPLRVVCLAAGLGIIAQAGDLAESRIKRHFGVKDSGHLIPGHGGLLDRLDAVLAVAPVAAVLALFAGPGVALWQ